MIDLVKEKVFQEKYVRLEKAEQESIKKKSVFKTLSKGLTKRKNNNI